MNKMHFILHARPLDHSHQVYILSKFLEILNMEIFMNIAQGIKNNTYTNTQTCRKILHKSLFKPFDVVTLRSNDAIFS